MHEKNRETLFRALLLALVLVAATVRAFSPRPFPDDHDEVFQLEVIQASSHEFWWALQTDAVHPPLDYLVDRAALWISSDAISHRLPDLLWGTFTVAVLGLLLRRRRGRVAGLIAAGLLALAPYHVAETRRLRPYALAALLICVSLLLLDSLLARPSRVRAAVFFAAAAACLWTLYVAGLVLAVASTGMAAEALLSSDPETRARAWRATRLAASAAILALISFVPWFPTILRAARRPPFALAPREDVARVGRILSFFAFSPMAGYRFPPNALFFAGFALAVALFAFGAAVALAGEGTRFLVVWGAGSVAAFEVLKEIHPHFDSYRYFLPAGIAFTCLWAVALALLFSRPRARALAALLLTTVVALDGISLARYYRFGVWNFSSGRTKTASPGLARPRTAIPSFNIRDSRARLVGKFLEC
jgi:4-amino-4-deoxy-L-arabinose transferase-like glycosyltransferase